MPGLTVTEKNHWKDRLAELLDDQQTQLQHDALAIAPIED